MEQRTAFTYAPSKGKGILFLSAVCAALAGIEVFLWKRFDIRQIDFQFILLLIAMLIFAVPLIFLFYRLYSLVFSYYRLERDGLHIQWGMRSETIPLNAIEWIRAPEEMTEDVPWSVLPMPGAYLGTVPIEDHQSFEFLASDMGKMLFLGTSRYIYAISPRDPAGFMTGFERILQMGALTNVSWTSTRPANWLLEAWNNKIGRIATLLSVGFLILLYIWAGLHFQTEAAVSMLFSYDKVTVTSLPAIRMQILPLAATVIWLLGTLLGLSFYHRKSTRRIAELVWAAVSAAVLQCLIASFLVFFELVWGVVSGVYLRILLQIIMKF